MLDESRVEVCYWAALRQHAINNDVRFGDRDKMWMFLGAATAYGAVIGKEDGEVVADAATAMRDEYAEFPERLKGWSGSQ